MARPARRKQVGAAPAAAQSIASFARVSKTQVFPDVSAKKVAVSENSSTRKRKAAAIENPVQRNHPRVTRRTASFAPSSDDEDSDGSSATAKRSCRREEPSILVASSGVRPVSTPTSIRGKRTARAAPSRTVTAHRPSESTIITKSKQVGKTVQTKLDAFRNLGGQKTETETEFPPDLADLIRLHRAFLKTTMLQIAHTGANVPIDISSISPNISRLWGKRQVTVDDIRRCLALQASTQDPNIVSPFIVSDYGRGKICLEFHPDQSHDGLSINEERLCKQFEDNLRGLCSDRATDDMMDADLPLSSLSLADLPQADIKNKRSGISTNPILSKGHRALSELKEGLSAKQQKKEIEQQTTISMTYPDGQKMSLLDRIRLKQLTKANEPLPPSGPELERRAALNRVEDVAATISMLSLSNPMSLPRQAFTMATLSEKLKDSLRVPLSKEEGNSCIRLIAKEVAPEWLKVVMIGGRENVVVQRNQQPVSRIIQERVQKLMG